MMSYTMACTSSCSIGGRLIRRISPWTRIIGGSPADRCRSEALFLTAKARSSAMSIYNPCCRAQARRAPGARLGFRPPSVGRRSLGPDWLCRRHSIMSPYEKAWQAVEQRIREAARAAGRDPASVRVLAVSKSMPAGAIRAVHALGQRAFGENYVQEASAKMAALADLPDIEWHLIGPLQTNKARTAAAQFAWIQSIDRLSIAERLS